MSYIFYRVIKILLRSAVGDSAHDRPPVTDCAARYHFVSRGAETNAPPQQQLAVQRLGSDSCFHGAYPQRLSLQTRFAPSTLLAGVAEKHSCPISRPNSLPWASPGTLFFSFPRRATKPRTRLPQNWEVTKRPRWADKLRSIPCRTSSASPGAW